MQILFIGIEVDDFCSRDRGIGIPFLTSEELPSFRGGEVEIAGYGVERLGDGRGGNGGRNGETGVGRVILVGRCVERVGFFVVVGGFDH